jgi:creatinine amidohydrolase
MRRTLASGGLAVLLTTMFAGAQPGRAPAGVALSDLSWVEAESALTPSAVVVIPLGAATLEHGPHLKLNNDERLARYLASRVQNAASVVVAPSVTYHFNPAFLEYPGTTSLTRTTATNMTVEIVRTLARYGSRRFYILNTAGSAMNVLNAAVLVLAGEGILLRFTAQLQNTGSHADDLETSMMLFVDPSAVDMKKAVREDGIGSGPLTRQKNAPGLYSASGVVGDPTLATREKGQRFVEDLVSRALADIDKLRSEPLPEAVTRPPAPMPAPQRPIGRSGELVQPNGCTLGDERTIRDVGTRFSYLWRQLDSEAISLLFTPNGDIRHPDGTIERGRTVIRQDRQELFGKREYRGSVHPVYLNDIRCLGPSYAIADGKWELRLVDSPGTGAPGAPGRADGASPTYSGWCTLVLAGSSGVWSIEAWRYTVNPPSGTSPPTTLKQPGFIGRQ